MFRVFHMSFGPHKADLACHVSNLDLLGENSKYKDYFDAIRNTGTELIRPQKFRVVTRI